MTSCRPVRAKNPLALRIRRAWASKHILSDGRIKRAVKMEDQERQDLTNASPELKIRQGHVQDAPGPGLSLV